MKHYDVLIVGGSHSGLSAAMALGRMLRSVLVVDEGKPRNMVSTHANNFAGLDGIDPSDFREMARRDLCKYSSVELMSGRVLKIEKQNKSFRAVLSSGLISEFKRVILACGIEDRLPEVEGFWELWGKSIFHCPYCHGFEVKNKKLGFVGNGPFAEHLVPMLKGISSDLILFTQGEAAFSENFSQAVDKNRIAVHSSAIESLNVEGESLHSVAMSNGKVVEVDALFVAPVLPAKLNTAIADELGCERTEMGLIAVQGMGKTSVEGVFAAGDIASIQHSVVGAAATGQSAGSAIVTELVNEDFFS